MSQERSVRDVSGLYTNGTGGEGGIRTLVGWRCLTQNSRWQDTHNKGIARFVNFAAILAGSKKAEIGA
jgi:hypothetical protein